MASGTYPMLEQVRGIRGVDFGPEDYLDDFWPHFKLIDDVFWKLERIQDCREPDEPSWVAMMEGDWDRALTLVDATRSGNPRDIENPRGLVRRRVRIVEQPVTPYLQWEMQMLRLRVAVGEQIRVLDARAVERNLSCSVRRLCMRFCTTAQGSSAAPAESTIEM
jgi:hypothetical protein